jgi:hypothetical protein
VRVWRIDGDDGGAPGREPGRDLGEIEVGAGVPLRLALPPLPARGAPIAPSGTAPQPHAHAPPSAPTSAWSARPAWPSAPWAVLVVSALGIATGLGGAVGVQHLAARRRWSRLTAFLLGCALAFFGGGLLLAGAHIAVATAVGFGAFIGTAIFGAAER